MVIQQAIAFWVNGIKGYWGHGDFIIGLPNLDQNQGKEHLTELLTILRKQVFTSPQSDRFQVSFNCATAELTPDAQTLHSLYQACCTAVFS